MSDVSWLRLRPDNRSGKKIIGKGRLPANNRATIALKMAASTLRKSSTYLGAQFSSTPNQARWPCAIKAMKYADKGATFYQHQYRQLQIKQLKWRAASLGYQVTSLPAAA